MQSMPLCINWMRCSSIVGQIVKSGALGRLGTTVDRVLLVRVARRTQQVAQQNLSKRNKLNNPMKNKQNLRNRRLLMIRLNTQFPPHEESVNNGVRMVVMILVMTTICGLECPNPNLRFQVVMRH